MNYRKISADELKQILDLHKEWLADNSKGARANLRSANLRSANLSYADLSYADLSYADLSYADLSYADLRYADLRSANLRSADLSSADLSSAKLSYADLRSAHLSSTNLLIFKFQKHTAYSTLDGSLRIGCHVLPISKWMQTYESIGKSEGYTDAQIEAYGDFIKLCLKQFELVAKERK